MPHRFTLDLYLGHVGSHQIFGALVGSGREMNREDDDDLGATKRQMITACTDPYTVPLPLVRSLAASFRFAPCVRAPRPAPLPRRSVRSCGRGASRHPPGTTCRKKVWRKGRIDRQERRARTQGKTLVGGKPKTNCFLGRHFGTSRRNLAGEVSKFSRWPLTDPKSQTKKNSKNHPDSKNDL